MFDSLLSNSSKPSLELIECVRGLLLCTIYYRLYENMVPFAFRHGFLMSPSWLVSA